MKKKKSFLLTGAIALTAMVLNTACADKDLNPIDYQSWDAGKIAGDVTGVWYGETENDDVITVPSGTFAGKRLYANKEVHAFQFNEDGTGTCYKFLCNVAGEPIDIYGGLKDKKNGRFTYTTNKDSTITITRVGSGNSDNPKTWKAVLTKDGLSTLYGNLQLKMDVPVDWELAHLTKWEDMLRPAKAKTRADGDSDDNSDDDIVKVSDYEWYSKSFLTNWWEQTDMELSKIGTVHTPWGGENTNDAFDIPDIQRFYNSASNGWEMCFCKFNDTSAKYQHYFGLYNKWTAMLRVFFYADDEKLGDYGNELIFSFQSGESERLKTPFYHAMTYGIPANHTIKGGNLKEQFNLTGSSGSSVTGWDWYQSPYSKKVETNGVAGGWHCVDFDMSGWNPYTENWATSTDEKVPMVTIDPLSRSTSSVTLTGELIGNVQGSETTYEKKTKTSSTCSGFSNFYNYFGSCASTLTSNSMGLMMGVGMGSDASGAIGIASFVVGCVNGIFSMIDSSLQQEEEYVDSTVTNISMTVDADIDLSGEIKEWKSTSDSGIDLKRNTFTKANEDGHIGKGLWSLDEDPVVYVSKEDLLANTDHFTMSASSDGLSLSDFADKDVRLVYFLDPTSIKININNDIFHNPTNVKMQCGVALCTDQDLGNTDCYRDLMYLDDRPTFKLSSQTSGNVKLNSSSTPRLTKLTIDDIEAKYDTTFTSWFSKEIIPNSDNMRTYGPLKKFSGFERMLFPQIYVPYDGSSIKEAEVPDLYVYVEVQFECDETKGSDDKVVVLVKHFIPTVKLCTHDEMSTWYDTLKEYCDNSENGNATGTLAHPESTTDSPNGVDVTDIYAYKMFKPMLYWMQKALGKEE